MAMGRHCLRWPARQLCVVVTGARVVVIGARVVTSSRDRKIRVTGRSTWQCSST